MSAFVTACCKPSSLCLHFVGICCLYRLHSTAYLTIFTVYSSLFLTLDGQGALERIPAELELWRELCTFAKAFLVHPSQLNAPSLSSASNRPFKSSKSRAVDPSAQNKDCILVPDILPRICDRFDQLVRRGDGNVAPLDFDTPELSVNTEDLDKSIQSKHDIPSSSEVIQTSSDNLTFAERLKLQKIQNQTDQSPALNKVATAQKKTKSEKKIDRGDLQQDAVEFLTFFLDALHEDLQLPSSSVSLSSVDVTNERMIILDRQLSAIGSLVSQQLRGVSEDEEDSGWSRVQTRSSAGQQLAKLKVVVDDESRRKALLDLASPSIIRRLFHGLFRCEVVYKAKKTCSVTFQRFHCLTLHPHSGVMEAAAISSCREVALEDALKNYFASEV